MNTHEGFAMRQQHAWGRRPGWLAFFGAILLGLVALPSWAEDSGRVSVIAHPSVQSEYLTRAYLRSVFTSRVRAWPNGEPVRVFVLDDADPIHASFSREILGTFPYVLRNAWDRVTFTGTGLVPVRVRSIEEMRQRVLETPGAVGYLPTDMDSLGKPLLSVAKARGTRWN